MAEAAPLAGPFSAVESALRSGRWAEALGALKRCSGAAPRWETFLWLGRIEEQRGRLARAEEAFRRAADADAKAAPELNRFLEDERHGAFRKALLAEAGRKRGGLSRFEARAREALAGGATAPLLGLIEAGRYPPSLERALLAAVSRAKPGDKLAAEWPQLFSALMCARRYPQAFRLGEAVLDAFGRLESPGQLMWPWWRMIRRAVAEDEFIDLELKRIRAAAARGGFPQWFAFYRAILLSDASRDQAKAMLEYERIKDLDADRYSWMLQSFVLVKLGVPDYPGAIAVSRDILSRAPSHWWVRCRMAEAYMAGGDAPQALREFDEAERTCGPGLLGEVLTWHGEVLLWLGEYDRALEKLDAAVALGAKTFVFGWRGAARFKSGDFAGALSDLDRAVALDPKDLEARGWRGEVYRVLGRADEALADVEHVIRHGPNNYWTFVNRALLRDGLGDEDGMAADVGRLPQDMLALLMTRLKIERKKRRLTRGQMRKLLTAALAWAKGIRRWETYVQPIWMERTT